MTIPAFNAQSSVWRLTVLSEVKGLHHAQERLTWYALVPPILPSRFPKLRSVLTEKSKPTPSVTTNDAEPFARSGPSSENLPATDIALFS
jgi:hypothetical protein